MPTVLAYISVASVAVAVMLAVARDVPILHLALPVDSTRGQLYGIVCGLLILAALYLGGPWLHAAGWIGGLVCFWGVAIWHLWEGR